MKRLQNIAYQLGQEETKEMTRGKYLNILRFRGFSETIAKFCQYAMCIIEITGTFRYYQSQEYLN